MTTYTVSRVVQDTASTHLKGLADIDLRLINGNWVLVAASEEDGALTTWRYTFDSSLTFRDQQTYSIGSGTHVVSEINFAQIGNQHVVIPATRYEDSARVYSVGGNGDFSNPAAPGGGIEGFGTSTSITIGGNTYVYAGLSNTSGLVGYQMQSNLQMNQIAGIPDSFNLHLRDLSALQTLTIGGAHFLYATSAFDSGLDIFGIGNNGQLSLVDTINNGDGTGFYRPSDLDTVMVNGDTYLAMASSGSSTLTAYLVDGTGNLTETDQIWDNTATRFLNATSLATFTYQDRGFVAVAGADDGFSVFEIMANGQFREILSIEDTYDIALDDVSGLDVEVFGNTAVVFVSSAGDDGFTQININLNTLPPEYVPPPSYTLVEGTDGDDGITGTGASENVVGKGGNDVLDGSGGNDLIDGGAGEDRLRGGAGSDIFVFTADGDVDYILDFNRNQDKIDLSGFAGVNYFNQLVFGYHGDDIGILVGNDLILLSNSGQENLQITQLTSDLFIF